MAGSSPSGWRRSRGLGASVARRLPAARAGSGSHLRDDAEDAMERGEEGSGGRAHSQASVTEWTLGTSPGCRRGGCCYWSHCRSFGGWSSWLLPVAASACSSRGRGERHEPRSLIPAP